MQRYRIGEYMPRTVTVTLSDNRQHVYNNVPDTVTPDQIQDRAEMELGAKVISIDGGRKSQSAQKPSTTLEGVAGAITRGAAPVATGATLGAVMGAPFAGVGAVPGAAAGATATVLTEMVGDSLVDMINRMLGTNYTKPSEAMHNLLTKIGIPEPKTKAERIIEALSSGASAGLSGAAAGNVIQGIAKPGSVSSEVGKIIADLPGLQVAAGASSGVASQGTAELGGGPLEQIVAGLVGGLLPVGAPLATGRIATITKPPIAAERIANATKPLATAAGESLARPAPETATAQTLRQSLGGAAQSQEGVRALTAENLPVPVMLTKGAATRDAAQLAFEKEMMKNPQLGGPLRTRAEKNNIQALENFDALIYKSGAKAPDPSATGNKLIKTLSQGYQAAKNKTRVAYREARNSEEAAATVDPNAPVSIGEGENAIQGSFIDYLNSKVTGVQSSSVTDAARKYAVKLGIASEGIDGTLAGNPTTVGGMEDLRREISGIAKWDDPPGIRDETILKKIIDAQTEPVSGPLFKQARKIRQEQARKYENRAIIYRLLKNKKGMDDPQVAVDQVFKRTILDGSPEEITFLKRVLQTSGEDGKQTWNELQGATIRHIKEEATKGLGMDSGGNPLVSPAKLHQAVTQLDKNGRLDIIFGKKTAETMRDLNDIVRYVNTVPPGTLVNSSGTAGTIMAAIIESGVTGTLTGLPVPVLTGLRFAAKQIKNARIKAKINDALKVRERSNVLDFSKRGTPSILKDEGGYIDLFGKREGDIKAPMSSNKGPGEKTTGATPKPEGGIYYHGTRSLPFDEFDTEHGAFFTTSPEFAKSYTDIRQSQVGNKKYKTGKPRVIQVRLRINNPLDLSMYGSEDAIYGPVSSDFAHIEGASQKLKNILGNPSDDEILSALKRTSGFNEKLLNNLYRDPTIYALKEIFRIGQAKYFGKATAQNLLSAFRYEVKNGQEIFHERMDKDVKKFLEALGFDGIKFNDTSVGSLGAQNEAPAIVAFNPGQIEILPNQPRPSNLSKEQVKAKVEEARRRKNKQ